MNFRVAVCAPQILTIGIRQYGWSVGSTVPVVRMALLAQKRPPQLQEVVIDGAVLGMTGGALLHDIGMLIEIGAGLFRMAAGAGLPDRYPRQKLIIGGAVRLMAVRAVDLVLLHRMMTRQGKLHPDRPVASDTELIDLAR